MMATSIRENSENHDNLEKLYFGKDDAESDFARGGLLKQGFMRTRAYEEALAGRKNLIIGRKGSGKSAIALMLRNSLASESRCVLVTPDEISADEIRRFQLPGIPQEQSKQLIWRYVFVVQVAKFILAASQITLSRDESITSRISTVRKFLTDNGELEDLTLNERFWKVIEKLRGAFSIEAFSVRVTLDGEVKPPSPGTKANDQLDIVEAHLNKAAADLELISTGRPFHLVVDQVDKVWSNDRESDSMVVGLLLAAKELQRNFSFVVATVFLRTDIYERLQFHDRDKFRGDEFHIDWTERHLLDLVAARAQASLGLALETDQIWRKYFPDSVESQNCPRFLVSRTLMRPRDIIQLCNACRDTARNNQHPTIEEQDIRKALSVYSNWKLGDLQSEWSVNYPFLSDLFILLSNTSYLIGRDNFEATLLQVKSDFIARYPILGHAFSADSILSVLYSIGLLGVVRHGKTCYSFGQNSERQIQAKDLEFVLHPCFRSALQSTSAIKLSAFESILDIERRGARSRFDREALIGHLDIYRGARSERGFRYLGINLERLRMAVEKSSLPEEIRTEVSSNLAAMLAEVREVDIDYENPLVVREVMLRQHRHLRQMSDRLSDSDWLSENKDLKYIFSESVEELEKFAYRGTLAEYDRS